MKHRHIISYAIATFILFQSCSRIYNDTPEPPIDNNNSIESSIYKPKPGISWQWQLEGDINTTHEVDLYDIDLENTPKTLIDELHQKGIKVICYFSAGTLEEYRSDANTFPEEIIGNPLEDWPDEKWLDISQYQQFAPIMEKRLDMAAEKGCNGIEPDNIDAYQNNSGFNITYEDQLAYNTWLAEEAHKRNLSIALKNDLDQIQDLVDIYDFAINEECFSNNECDKLLPFIEKEKVVLGVEYELETKDFCEKANKMGFSFLKMEYDLHGERIDCKTL